MFRKLWNIDYAVLFFLPIVLIGIFILWNYIFLVSEHILYNLFTSYGYDVASKHGAYSFTIFLLGVSCIFAGFLSMLVCIVLSIQKISNVFK